MKRLPYTPLRLLFFTCIATLTVGCGGGDDGGSGGDSNLSAMLSNYTGTWTANCTATAPTSIFTLSITSSGQYWLVTKEYDSTANCGNDANISYSQINTSTVSSVETNASNSLYNDIYLSNSAARFTPHSADQVSSWISSVQCGKTDWSTDSEAEFNASNTGNGCYQINSRTAVQLEGASLSMNGRGSFDGADPDDIVFTKQSSSPQLTGTIGGSPWMVVSGKVSPGFDAGTLSYTFYDSYVPDICNNFHFSSRSVVLFSSDEATGTYPLGLSSSTVTLYDGTTNYIVTTGSVEIDTLSSAIVGGNMSATYNSNNAVSGEFSLSRCP